MNYAFQDCISLSSVDIPTSVTALDGAFSGCTSLSSVNIPTSVTSLNYTFSGCTSLSSVDIPTSVTALDGTFSDCTSLTSVKIPISVNTLMRTFYGCTGLTSIEIPSSVKGFDVTFNGCTNLVKVTCQWRSMDGLWWLGDPFGNMPTASAYLYVPKGFVDTYRESSLWSSFGNIVEQGGGTVVSQCATPTITYTDKTLSFATATEGAMVHYDIVSADMKSGDLAAAGDISLDQAYKITAYTVKDGYMKSDNVVAMLYFMNGTLDNPTAVKAMKADSRGILVTSAEGRIMVSGLNDGEKVSAYSTSGVMLGMGTAYAGQAEINVSTQDSIVVIKVGGESIKYAM